MKREWLWNEYKLIIEKNPMVVFMEEGLILSKNYENCRFECWTGRFINIYRRLILWTKHHQSIFLEQINISKFKPHLSLRMQLFCVDHPMLPSLIQALHEEYFAGLYFMYFTNSPRFSTVYYNYDKFHSILMDLS